MTDQVMIPDLCYVHTYDLVRTQLKLSPDDPWRVYVACSQVLLFQGASADARVWDRAGGSVENLSLVLAEIGCLACWDVSLYLRVVKLAKKGLEHMSAVSQGKIADEGFDMTKKAES